MATLGIDPRRLGTGLLAFGVIGALLAGVVAIVLVIGGLSARSLGDRLEADRVALVAALQRASDSIDGASVATGNVQATLDSTETVVGHTSDTLVSLGGAIDGLADALDFSILGQQPLAGAAAAFSGIGDQLRTYAEDLDAVAVDLAANQDDLTSIAADLDDLATRIDAVADRLDAFDRVEELVGLTVLGVVLMGAVVAWVAIAAGLLAWVGWRLRRTATDTPASPTGAIAG
jgi:hypothetical protein